ncbi:hypothetical protein F1715_11670, partial [Streptococcus pneumoniae]|uniref:DEAD/DEAH box helicase family protein n=1 Tax=Streptococcus pneumoniae TaxID=1313 RepID=UPI00122F2362
WLGDREAQFILWIAQSDELCEQAVQAFKEVWIAVLTLPTGAGKTRTTVEALTDWWLGDREAQFILWIAQSDELCEQAVQAFKEVWI